MKWLVSYGLTMGNEDKEGVLDEKQRKTSGTDEGTGTKPGVLDVPTYDSESENESWGDNEDDNNDDIDDDSKGDDHKAGSDDDGNSNADDNERTDSDDDDENPSFTLKDYDEEEHDDEYESDDDNENVFEEEDDDLYKDVDVRLLGAEQEQERKGDEEMTDADQNVSQEKSYEQVVEDAHVTLTSSQKTESSKQSSSVSSDFASKFLILENVPPTVDEVASMMNVKIRQEESSTQAPSLFTVPVTAIPETATAHATTLSQLKEADHSAQLLESIKSQLLTIMDDLLSIRIGYATRTALESYTKEFEKKAQEERKLYIDFVKKLSTITKSLENVMLAKSSSQPQSTYEAATSLIEFELKKILIDKLEKSKLYRAAKDLQKPLRWTWMKTLHDRPTKGPTFNLLKGTCKSFMELEYHFEECYKAVTDQLDWNNPEGHEYPFDLSKPLPLIEAQGRQVVPADYFFNNDLEYLKGGSASRKYTTSTTKTKAAKYDNIEGIEDMVLTLWSPVKVAYDKFAMWGISHWGPKRQKFYGYASNRESKHDVFSRKRIIAVTHVKVMKWYGYGYLEEIIVRREDQTLHKFKEGDFPRLNLRDIEDLLLLLVQKKLSNLEKDVIFDLNVALRMFTRRIVILKRVEDLQLGVESYQKKLNITKPETFRSGISKLTPYTAYKNPQGIIYQDKLKRNMLMRSDELYKFCDGTLSSVRRILHDIASNLEMDYLPKRR
ncbi:hypothetical protein Tco_0216752 [Tanacetum coccineum]